jgi:hypothetical protein
LRRLEHGRLVGEFREEVRELEQQRAAVGRLLEDAAQRVARLAEVGVVGEQRGHDLARKGGFGIELEQQRRAFEGGSECARANRRLDRAPRDLRILQFAREAMEDLQRALHVAALRRDLGNEEFVHRFGSCVAAVGFRRIVSLLGDRGAHETEGQCRDNRTPPGSDRHPCLPVPPKTGAIHASIIERFEPQLRVVMVSIEAA